MKMILIIFKKNFCLGRMEHFGPKNGASSCLWICCRNFLELFHSEKCQWVDETNNNDLYQKHFVQDKWVILGPKMAHPHDSGSSL